MPGEPKVDVSQLEENKALVRRFYAELDEGNLDVKAVSIYRIQDGKIAEHWSAVDTAANLQQLGVIELPF